MDLTFAVDAPLWGWFALAVLADVASMGAYARLQRRLLRAGGTRVSRGSAAALAFASHSLSDTLPGGPVFSTVFSFRRMRSLGASAEVASWAIALSGVLSSAALVVIGVAAGLVVTGSTDAGSLVGYAVAVVALPIGLRAVRRHPDLPVTAALRVLGLVDRLLRRGSLHGRDQVIGFVDALTAVRLGGRDAVVVSTLAVVNWLLDAGCFYLCLLAVGVDGVSPAAVLLAYTAGMAALSIPLVPGGLGVVDGALILGLVTAGVSPSLALAATVLFRVISLGMIVGAGWVVWLFLRAGGRGARDEGARAASM